jgi:hypothetical protein
LKCGKEVSADERDPLPNGVATGISDCQAQGFRGKVGGDQAALRQRVRKRDGDRTDPGSNIEDTRPGMRNQAVDERFNQNFGFGPGDECIRADVERQGEKFGLPEQVLERHAAAPLLNQGSKSVILGRWE